ncbi:MAG: hypothetical protein GXP47_00265 [Acidobacteria bacterium]|nr:hypothetical protein [Acidobacteriota bacterium]
MRMAFGCVGLVCLFVVAAAEAGAQCGPWTIVPGPPAQGSRAAVWTGDRFVAVGEGFFVSPDGRSWRNVPQAGFPPNGDVGLSWSAVAFNGHQLVAVADHGEVFFPGDAEGTGAIAISSNGERWKLVVPVVSQGLHAVAWGGGRWVAAGDSIFLWSEDGTSWHEGTVVSGPAGVGIWSVVFTGSRWVALGVRNSGIVATSEDGVTWNVDPVEAPMVALANNGAATVAVGGDVALTSTDGISWTSHKVGGDVSLFSLSWVGEHFVAGGVQRVGWESGPPVALGSTEGSSWKLLSTTPRPVSAMAAGHGFFVALSSGMGVMTSRDGTSWELSGGIGYGRSFQAVQAVGGRLMAVVRHYVSFPYTYLGSGPFRSDLAISTDGIHWEHHPIDTDGYSDLAWKDGRYLALAPDGLMSSLDGVSWYPSRGGLPTGSHFHEVAAGPPGFIASLSDNNDRSVVSLYYSDDGLSWTRAATADGTAIPGRALSWAVGRFIAASEDRVATSVDGLHWTVSMGSWGTNGFSAFAGNGSRFVGIGKGSLLAWSDHGLQWTAVNGIPEGDLFSVTWDGEEFLVAGADFLLRSADGIHWSSEALWDTPWYGGIAVLDGRTVIAGRDGSLLVRACPDETLDAGAGFRMALPAMAHTAGRNGTAWRSDLVLHNPGDRAVRVGVWPAHHSRGAGGVASASLVVEPGRSVTLQDLLPGFLGSDEPSGGAFLTANAPLLAASRTFNGQKDGTWGQNVPLLSPGDWIEAGQRAVIPGIGEDASVRTNLGLLNPNGSALVVHVRFHDADGALLGERSWTVPAWGWRQIDQVLEKAQAAPVSLAWADLEADGDLVVYASVIDNATGDAVTVLPAAPADGDLVVPAAAHAPGFGGVVWRTDLDLVAAGAGPARYRLELLPANGPVLQSGERTLEAGHAERLTDVVATVFEASGGGAIRIVPLAGELTAFSRTYAAGPAGSFGQAVAAQPVAEGGPAAGELRLVGLSGSLSDREGFRTDVGAVNLSDRAVALEIELRAGDGTLVGRRELDLAAESWAQLDRVFQGLAATPVVGGYAVITSADGLQDILAYASVIDNRTGDPVFLPAAVRAGP